jgi:DtxR family Mn-dependent transcriptional regulator
MHSATEENYLKAIVKISEMGGKESAHAKEIADLLGFNPGTVTEMLKKLDEKGLINYQKHKAVTLTLQGKKDAIKVIRKHRLWEYFLVDKLKYKWDEVHDIAEQMEHVQANDLIDRIDDFLGNPKFCPHGDPIPNKQGKFENLKTIILSKSELNKVYHIRRFKNSDDDFLKILDKKGIKLNGKITIKEIEPYDKTFTVMLGDKLQLLSEKIADQIMVS